MASNDYYELYRRSRYWLVTKMALTPTEIHRENINTLHRNLSIGLTLVDTLDDMVNEGRIEPQLAMKVVARFDRAVAEVLAEKVKARMSFKGHLDTYRFCDEVWTFLIKDVNFKLDGGAQIQADKVKIVSCNAKKPGET